MAEMAVSFAIDQLLPLLTEEVNLLKGVHKEFVDIKDELESIQAFLKDADKRAAAEGNGSEGVKVWAKQVREIAFRIEDIIDDYMIHVGQKPPYHGCIALLHKIAHLLKTMIPRHRIAADIRDIKSSVCGIKERSDRYGFQRSFEQGSSRSRGSWNDKWHDPRLASLYIEEADVVGFDKQRDILIDWMIKGRAERTVVSVVGMGGQGKTTLAKKAFDSKDVVGHFDCRVWITVSQSYDVEGLLKDMLLKFYKQKGEDAPMGIFQMDRGSLIEEIRNYLQRKRYIIVFDDVWSLHFWDDIEFAAIDSKNGSRIFITTRIMDVVVSCKKSSFIEVLELQCLTHEQSLELFNKKAFKFDYGGCCPKELIGISNEIVQKCNGLPLAIVAIGGLLSTREKNVFEWQRFRENLNLELKTNTHLIGINEILSLSYDDLPYYLKSCLLYFGVYPEDFEIRSKRVIRQWIAEGFVKEEKGKTLEEVAEGYLTELIHRSLVQVSSLRIDGKAKGCRVHDLIRDMILEKDEDFNFCKHISDDGQRSLSGIVRRLSLTAIDNVFMECIDGSHVRSLFCFGNKISLPFYRGIPKKYRLLKVLDFEGFIMIPKNLGNFIHLKYLSFSLSDLLVKFPKSIVMLQNLESLVLKDAYNLVLPKEISKLRKLRHLIGQTLSLIELKDDIGEMNSLQTLRNVYLDLDDGAAEVIKALGKLKQIRELGLLHVSTEYGSILSSSINEMQHLETLNIESSVDFIDLSLISKPTMLRKLTLHVWLKKFPQWMSDLQNLSVLKLFYPDSTKDPLQSLKNLQHLLMLSLDLRKYEGLGLHFHDGEFQKLKQLEVRGCIELKEIIIDKGSMPSLKKLKLVEPLNLMNIPTGIEHLEKLEDLYIWGVEVEFVQRIPTEDWNWIMEHVALVKIYSSVWVEIQNSRS